MRSDMTTAAPTTPTFKPFQRQSASDIPGIEHLSDEERLTIDVVARVLPFRTNNYVCGELIDWANVPNDPLFQLTFPQREMLDPRHFDTIASLIRNDASDDAIQAKVREIQLELNPHPSGQVQLNVPDARRWTGRGNATQVRPNRAVFRFAGPDVSRLLHLLLPLAPVHAARRPEVRIARG